MTANENIQAAGFGCNGRAAMLALQSSLVFSFGSAKVSPNGSMNFRHSSSSPNANWDLIKSTGIDTRYLKVVEKKKTSEVWGGQKLGNGHGHESMTKRDWHKN